MYLNLPSRSRADRRIHKTYEFLENFYLDVYPQKRRIWVGVAISSILLNLWLIFK
jgi:hypothetical protein